MAVEFPEREVDGERLLRHIFYRQYNGTMYLRDEQMAEIASLKTDLKRVKEENVNCGCFAGVD